MTNDIKAIADGLSEQRFLLVKRDLYYRSNNKGYTGIKANAGRYFEKDAMPDAGVVAIHEDDAPRFSKGCWDDVKAEYLEGLITTLEADNASLREALATIAARNFNCSAHQHGMAAAGLAERTLLALSTQGTTDKGDAS